MRTSVAVTGPTSLNASHEKKRDWKKGEKKTDRERERARERQTERQRPEKVGERRDRRMSGLSEWMTDRQQPDRRLTARRRADSLPLCRAFVTSSITGYRACWSSYHSSAKSRRASDFALSFVTLSLTGSARCHFQCDGHYALLQLKE